MGTKIKVCVILIAIILYYFYILAIKFDYQLKIHEFPQNNTCKYHSKRHIGPEDLTKIEENILISISNDNYQMYDTIEGLSKDTPKGYIWIYYIDEDISVIPEIQNLPENFVFQPLGIYYEMKSQTLYVMNHPYQGKGDRIEQFNVNTKDKKNIQISYVQSLQMPKELNGVSNDFIKINEKEFLVTQFIHEPNGLYNSTRISEEAQFAQVKAIFNTLFNNKVNTVFLCEIVEENNLQCQDTIIKGNLLNGIAWFLEDQILVSDTVTGIQSVLHSYKLNQDADKSNRLSYVKSFEITGHPDNIEFDVFENHFTVGGMIRMHDMFEQMEIYKENYPELDYKVENYWQFLDLIKYENGEYKVSNIFSRPDVNRGCSVGLTYKNKIILGSYIDKSISICDYDGSENQHKNEVQGIFQFYKTLLGF